MSTDCQPPVCIRPIGVVVSDFRDFTQRTNYEAESTIRIREELADGLLRLEHFSHIWVLYHQHRRKDWQRFVGWADSDEEILTVPLVGETSRMGIYTTRSPARPSGLGSCVVELLGRDGTLLRVKGLDAFDGTPVLDIKIYLPRYDCVPLAEAPLHWSRQKTEMLTTSRLLHWDTMNVGLAIGMRAGKRALQELGLGRSDKKHATVRGGNFFAQGVEAVTGCSVLHGTMEFEEAPKSVTDWLVRLETPERYIGLRIVDRPYAGADQVLDTPDDVLFSSVEAGMLLQEKCR
ncbi:MAG: tRNA (N6-threonylcarbamoyladenosine(37)-N6)-methyltransferase TrmO [Terriglobales bacterium]|jgi:tRNA (adenine37-N6)-methyltransferase